MVACFGGAVRLKGLVFEGRIHGGRWVRVWCCYGAPVVFHGGGGGDEERKGNE